MREEFPFFAQHPDLVYLDSAATTQKPQGVIDALTRFYTAENANIHRGLYDLAAQTSMKYEAVRKKVSGLLNAADPHEIIYTSGTTASINLVAQSFLGPRLKAGDEVLISAMEHHANLIPWQMVCRQNGAKIRVIPLLKDGQIDIKAFQEMLSSRVKMLAVVHISNSLGTINPVAEMIQMAHKYQIPVLVDGAQSTAHYHIDVQSLEADFFTFSGHKLFGPTGIGVLYGKMKHLEGMQPVTFGGDMIREVSYEEASFAPVPRRFEAGTTHIAGVIGLGAAIDFVQGLDQKWVQNHLHELKAYATEKLSGINGLRLIGTAPQKSAIFSFVLYQVHPHDVATFLGTDNIAIRAGHHCTQPLMTRLELPATTRASCSIYNTVSDIDRLVDGIRHIQEFFG
ncbi:MAG: SufS family cysteine desulfurase [Bacteroidota bacterium]